MACLRVRGSGDACETAKAQPVPSPQTGFSAARRRRSAAGRRLRKEYLPSPRRKCELSVTPSCCM
eukprot:3558099-Pleurochrysis_carterae.AAC.1